MPTKRQKEWMAAAAALGCVVCRNEHLGATPAELHHIREGYGRGQRAPDDETIPLCPAHHRFADGKPSWKGQIAFHQNREAFVTRYGTEKALLAQVRKEVYGSTG